MYEKNLINDFNLFSKSKGISSMDLYYANQKIGNSLTPYVLEERQLNVTQMDIFSRLLFERIICLGGEVDEKMAMITQAQLIFLDSIDNNDITLHIFSPGGSVNSGLSIISVMDYIKSDIKTVNTGMAASMGAVLLGAGTKGKRYSLKFSDTMLHASSSGLSGNIHDARITYVEWEKKNDTILGLLSEYTNKDIEIIKKDTERDLWLNPIEAKNYGIIDEIMSKK
jgi:ATP-dependent Clp protease protease subunit